MPRRHAGVLRRTRLLRQLRSTRDRPVISIVAPPGYGKSSLLVQWATDDSAAGRLADGRRQRQRPGRVPHRSRGGDRPLRAARSGALRRDRVGHGVAPDRGRSIAGGDVPTPGARPDRDRRRAPDHVRACLDILAELIEHLPEGSQVAIAGRARMRLPFARWRAEGSVLEIGPDGAGDGRARGRRAGTRARAAAAGRNGDAPDAGDRRVAGSAGARDARSPDVSGRTGSDRRWHRPPHRRLPAVRGARAPLHGRDRVPDPHVDPRRAARAAVRCRGGSTRVDRCPAGACAARPC